MKLTFLRHLIILFQNILFLKEFITNNGCFGLFTRIKKWSVTSLWCTFPAYFSNTNVPYLLLYQWTKSYQCHTFQDTKQNVILNSSGFPIQESRVQNYWVAPRSTQPFILPRSIKWVPGISGNLVVKSKLPPRSSNSLVAVEPHP